MIPNQVSLNRFIVEVNELCQSHEMVRQSLFGDILRIYTQQQHKYYSIMWDFTTGSIDEKFVNLTAQFVVSGWVYSDYSNIENIKSDCQKIASDIFSGIQYSRRWQMIGKVNGAFNLEPFIEKTGDKVAGWVVTMNFRLKRKHGICDAPFGSYDFDKDPTNGGNPVLIFENDILVKTLYGGDTYYYTTGICEPVTSTFNGSNLAPTPSGGTKTINVVNESGVDVGTAIVDTAELVRIEVDDGKWVRNPDWLPLPDVSAIDDVFVGLFLVFENETNIFKWRISGSGPTTVDVGDGTTPYIADGTDETHIYNYTTLPGAINLYKDGRNYKQVIITVTRGGFQSNFFIGSNLVTFPFVNANFVDIIWKVTTNPTAPELFRQYFATILEQVTIISETNVTLSNAFKFASNLRRINFEGTFHNSYQQFSNVFSNSSPIPIEVYPTNFFENFSTIGAFSIGFYSNLKADKYIVDVGNSMSTPFRYHQGAKDVEITFQNTASLQWLALDNFSIEKLKINLNSNALVVTNMNAICSSRALREFIFDNCDITRITATNFSAANFVSLKRLVMPGFTRGVVCTNSGLKKAGIEEIGGVIGTADGTQTYTFTNCPGSLTADYTQFFAKGYNIISA